MDIFHSQKEGNLIIAFIYFLVYAGSASFLAFYNLFLEENGFSGFRIGTIMALFQAVLVFSVIFWGYLADKNGLKKAILLSITTTIILIYLLKFVTGYFFLLLFIPVFAFFYHPNPTLIDTIAVHHSRNYPGKGFGQFRMWGSLGWGSATLLLGFLMTTMDLSIIFPVGAFIFAVIMILIALKTKNEVPEEVQNLVNLKDFKKVFANRHLSIFFILLFLYGISKAPLTYFINLYLKEIGASNSLIGFAFTVQAFCELPFFFFADKLVEKFGAKKVILFSILFTVLRLFLYSIISNPYIAIPLGAGHGITLGLFIVAVTQYVHKIVPVQWRATAQSMIWGFHFGAGITVGNLLIGYLKDQISMKGVMLWESIATAVVFVIITIYFYQTSKRKLPFLSRSRISTD